MMKDPPSPNEIPCHLPPPPPNQHKLKISLKSEHFIHYLKTENPNFIGWTDGLTSYYLSLHNGNIHQKLFLLNENIYIYLVVDYDEDRLSVTKKLKSANQSMDHQFYNESSFGTHFLSSLLPGNSLSKADSIKTSQVIFFKKIPKSSIC